MSLTEILEEVDRLNAAERIELARRLRARELAEDPHHAADVSARLDRALRGEGVVSEEELHRRLAERKASRNS